MMTRREFLIGATALGAAGLRADEKGAKILLRSSWQTINIGDIAHTPGMLRLLEQHVPGAEVTLWPSSLSLGAEEMIRARFPKLRIAKSAEEKKAALSECTFALHGSGPGLVGAKEMEEWRATGKPYGFGGVTLNDGELKSKRELLAGAKFIFCRDTLSLEALKASGIQGPKMEFGPDATFALDLKDESKADAILKEHELEAGKFACFVPRLRWTPYWREGRKMTAEQIAEKEGVNEKFAEADHAKVRAAIVAWVRETGKKALLCPEMRYEVELLRPLLFDKLPDDVKAKVAVRPSYWLTAEAASTYARADAIVSCEMHSPIIAIANGTPAIHVRQPTDTRKGQMWRDVGLGEWLFEVDASTGEQIAAELLKITKDREGARKKAAAARAKAAEHMKAMMEAVKAAL